MYRIECIAALFSILLILNSAAGADNRAALPPDSRLKAHQIQYPEGGFGRMTRPYRSPVVPPVNLANSNRLESLLRGGKLYLSLPDTIALALENNLDVELQRYGPQIADADVQRARAGGLLRGVPTSVQQGPSSATGQAGQATGISQSAAAQAASAGGAGGGTIITSTGTPVPNLDPSLVGFLRFAHTTTPQTSSFVTGTNTLIQRSDLANFSFQQGFVTGTTINLGFSNVHMRSTQFRADLNPSTSSSLSLNLTQRLLQGLSPAVNSRYIHIAKNNRELSDLVFKQQVITTTSAIANLYWDLVSFNQDVEVRKQSLSTSEKLYNDNKKQVEIGTLAPISIVQAEAEVAARRQDLTIAETRLLQQETILKNALSRNGVASPALIDAHIVPTDRIRMPDQEAIEPIQDLVAYARSARPELAQQRIQVENARISLRGSHSQLLPSLDAFVNMANNGLAGSPNTLPVPPNIPFPTRSNPDSFFLGGYGSVLSQVFSRNFPDYNAGFQLNIPLRNRSAQADMVRDELSVRQQELVLQRMDNQLRVEVQNALIGLQQARATYQAAQTARVLQEQTLDAEQKKYALGASTIYNVILIQRDLAQQQSNEVAALSQYSKARVELDRATGRTLEYNNISLDEAFRGTISRSPSSLPVVDHP